MSTSGVCSKCITGFVHDGKPKGTKGTIAGLPTYIAKTSSPKEGIIVIVPDAFGWEFINNQLLADEYADRTGFTVYLPDFMKGSSAPSYIMDMLHPLDDSKPTFFQKLYLYATMIWILIPWLIAHRPSVSNPIVKSFFETLRKDNPNVKIGAAGFCWGGKFSIGLGQKGWSETLLVDAIFAGHPSMIKLPDDVKEPVVPASIAAAAEDSRFGPDHAEQTKTAWKDVQVPTEVVVYEGVDHGFCIRGNMNNEKQKSAIEGSIAQACNWFEKYLA